MIPTAAEHACCKLTVLREAESAAREALPRAGFLSVPVPEIYAYREGEKKSLMESLRWLHPSGLEARCSLISSSQVEVLNLMIFPISADRCPVFASDLIVFGKKVRIAAVDLHSVDPSSPIRAEAEAGMAPLHKFHSQGVTHGGDLPEWAVEHFTTKCLYARPESDSETPRICEGFFDYLDQWIEFWLPRAKPVSGDSEHLANYMCHHVSNWPGRPFLGAVFGKEWTEDYLSHFMYAPVSEMSFSGLNNL